ncbi:MAG TPA: hypothetical protein VEK08_22535 [Planctomycetota bacterium]|nr:hypothetical protein [Planctomycetota bacterium]
MPDMDFYTSLAARRPGLDHLEPSWRLVDDVLAGRIKKRGADGWYSSYFPKGRLEPQSEYSLRMELTPFFPQTPQLLASRLGALFKTRLQVETSPPAPLRNDGERGTASRLENFLAHAGRRHCSFEDLAVQAACLAQSHGFCAALIDRDPLPEDLTPRPPSLGGKGEHDTAREVSQAEASARNLGRPYIALYGAPEILDWDFGSDGLLAWVKFGEEEVWRRSWDAAPEIVRVFRIVDRTHIHVYRVCSADLTPRPPSLGGKGENGGAAAGAALTNGAASGMKIYADEPIAHGFGEVPVVFLHPFPAADGIGRSMLLRSAEADIAASRVLSDLVWDLFLLGNPILTLSTSRSDEELTRLGLGATRYIPLRNGRPGVENAEELKFVQLDPTGIELLFRAHSLFAAQARAAGSGGDEAAAIPREVSGVAQAWRFKTGEERILFMLARALEPFLTRCLNLALTSPPAPLLKGEGRTAAQSVVVRLPETFDVTTPAEAIDGAEKLLQVAAQFGQTQLAKTALQRLETSLGVLPAQTREALAREREAFAFKGEKLTSRR